MLQSLNITHNHSLLLLNTLLLLNYHQSLKLISKANGSLKTILNFHHPLSSSLSSQIKSCSMVDVMYISPLIHLPKTHSTTSIYNPPLNLVHNSHNPSNLSYKNSNHGNTLHSKIKTINRHYKSSILNLSRSILYKKSPDFQSFIYLLPFYFYFYF